MEYEELIKRRESVRSYDPGRPVPRPVLQKILEAGRIAPSAANRQPFRFFLVSSAETLREVKRCYDKPWFKDAPHVLVVAGRADAAWTRKTDGYNSLETDVAIAMDHMILAAENEGVGTCWIAAYDPDILKKALALGTGDDVFAITPLGYPRAGWTRKTEKSRKKLEDIAVFI
jgi:nitroreductase